MSNKELSWLTVGVNTVTLKLTQPATFSGVKQDSLTLRAPLVRDIRNASKLAPEDNEERELILFAALAEVSPAELEGLTYKDYGRLQEGYFRLVSDDELDSDDFEGDLS